MVPVRARCAAVVVPQQTASTQPETRFYFETPFIPGTRIQAGASAGGPFDLSPRKDGASLAYRCPPSEQKEGLVHVHVHTHTHTAVSVLPDKPLFLSSWHTRLPSCPPSPHFIWASPQEITSVACVRILLYTPHERARLHVRPPRRVFSAPRRCASVLFECAS